MSENIVYTSRKKGNELQGAGYLRAFDWVSYSDYGIMTSLIRQLKPLFILECGTGRSTWDLAEALRKNEEEFGIKGLLVSVTDNLHWFNEAVSRFPKDLKNYTQIIFSARKDHAHLFIKGSVFGELPDYPYDLVFIHRPEVLSGAEGETDPIVSLDFIEIVKKSTKSVTAVLGDAAPLSILVHSLFLGKGKIRYNEKKGFSIIENVNHSSLLSPSRATLSKPEIFGQFVLLSDDMPLDPDLP
jgi:hypothetical protein